MHHECPPFWWPDVDIIIHLHLASPTKWSMVMVMALMHVNTWIHSLTHSHIHTIYIIFYECDLPLQNIFTNRKRKLEKHYIIYTIQNSMFMIYLFLLNYLIFFRWNEVNVLEKRKYSYLTKLHTNLNESEEAYAMIYLVFTIL